MGVSGPLACWPGSKGPGERLGRRASLMVMTDLAQPSAAHSDAGDRQRPEADASVIDWQALRIADRACCCPARPVVVAVMPPAPGRDHPTDLLLCGHHYRASRTVLDRAGAAIFDSAGKRVTVPARAWPTKQGATEPQWTRQR